MPEPQALPQLDPLPAIEQNSLPLQRQAAAAPPIAQAPPASAVAPPPPTPLAPIAEPTPPPVTVQSNTAEDAPIVKKRKSKRKELQQASGGTDALRIKQTGSKLGSTPSGSTGSSGLNIPK